MPFPEYLGEEVFYRLHQELQEKQQSAGSWPVAGYRQLASLAVWIFHYLEPHYEFRGWKTAILHRLQDLPVHRAH